MQIAFIITATILILLLIILILLVLKLISENKINATYIKHLKDEIKENAKNIDLKLLEQQRDLRDNVKYQFSESQKLISEITKELTEVKEGNKQVFNLGQQLSNLEKVLTNQKQRGNWGEGSLELILDNVLKSHYTMQYRFKDGEVVDAVIHIKDKILPIDSKFSLDNYTRAVNSQDEEEIRFYAEEFKKDLKKRVEETSKYIKEEENTLPIAFMFIPSEAIFYDLLSGEQGRLKINTQKLLDYAQANKVFIVSPTSILAYLHLVLSGIKAFQIEENAKLIQNKVEELGKHIEKYEEYYRKLGSALDTTVNHYNAGYKELKKIDKDVYKITEKRSGNVLELNLIEKTKTEEE